MGMHPTASAIWSTSPVKLQRIHMGTSYKHHDNMQTMVIQRQGNANDYFPSMTQFYTSALQTSLLLIERYLTKFWNV